MLEFKSHECPFEIEQYDREGKQFVIRCPSDDGFKSWACRLAELVSNGRYIGRAKGYVATKGAVERFKKLYQEGWRASVLGTRMRRSCGDIEQEITYANWKRGRTPATTDYGQPTT